MIFFGDVKKSGGGKKRKYCWSILNLAISDQTHKNRHTLASKCFKNMFLNDLSSIKIWGIEIEQCRVQEYINYTWRKYLCGLKIILTLWWFTSSTGPGNFGPSAIPTIPEGCFCI